MVDRFEPTASSPSNANDPYAIRLVDEAFMIQLVITMTAALLQIPGSAAAPKPATPATPIVEVVDPDWLALPGTEVVVTSQARRRQSWHAVTDEDGSAPFSVGRPGKYIIEVTLPGFKRRRLKNVSIDVASATPMAARVQLRLTMADPSLTVY